MDASRRISGANPPKKRQIFATRSRDFVGAGYFAGYHKATGFLHCRLCARNAHETQSSIVLSMVTTRHLNYATPTEEDSERQSPSESWRHDFGAKIFVNLWRELHAVNVFQRSQTLQEDISLGALGVRNDVKMSKTISTAAAARGVCVLVWFRPGWVPTAFRGAALVNFSLLAIVS